MRAFRNGIITMAMLASVNAHAATFTVISADDGDGTCDGNHCSLREAIKAANLNASVDSISFEIPGSGHTIRPATALPIITDPVVIDGYTQRPCSSNPPPCSLPNAFFAIELDGTGVGGTDNGLFLTGGGSTVRGLVINHFGGDGIHLEGAGNNTITGNRITLNGRDGVRVMEGTGNAIVSNAIFDNAGLGIDLAGDGVTPNDADDADHGANDLQNFPELSSVWGRSFSVGLGGGTFLTIAGSLHTNAHKRVTLEFFACDSSGSGEGKTRLGSTIVTTPSAGLVTFTGVILTHWPGSITATSTDSDGNTSEFSSCVPVALGGNAPQFHNMAVVALSAPKDVKLSTRAPTATRTVKVVGQNRSPHSETIANAAVLADLVNVTVDSLAGCADPTPTLVPPKKFPIVLKSKQKLVVRFTVPFACANDPAKTRRTAAHDDYRDTAVVNHAALDGVADSHPGDDVCPRDTTSLNFTPPSFLNLDPLQLLDKGCGVKKAVLTDVEVQ